VTINEPSRVSKYSFGTKTAHFHICANCGVTPVVTSQIDGRLYAVVNVNTFEGADPSFLRQPSAQTFDTESEEVPLRAASATGLRMSNTCNSGAPGWILDLPRDRTAR
jgi:hypothetical protein